MRRVVVVNAWHGQLPVAELAAAAARGEQPRKDYVLLAERTEATVLDDDRLTRSSHRLVRALTGRGHHRAAQLAELAALHDRDGCVHAWDDNTGLMLASLPRVVRGRLSLTSVLVSTPTKSAFIRATRVPRRLERVVFYSSVQRERAISLGFDPARVSLLLQPVDEQFFRPELASNDELIVCAVGAEARDYPTFVEAVAPLHVHVEIAIGSMVFTPTELFGGRTPRTMRGLDEAAVDTTTLEVHRHLGPRELRDLYRRSAVAVVPLHDVAFDAGVTAVVEAMAMAKPVIVSGTTGQVDVLEHGVQGLYVPPEDPVALRGVLESLLADEPRRRRMGVAGRATVEARHRLDDYVTGLQRALGWE
jgi:glycosyltransferase involved in cell wall biosynthesis